MKDSNDLNLICRNFIENHWRASVSSASASGVKRKIIILFSATLEIQL